MLRHSKARGYAAGLVCSAVVAVVGLVPAAASAGDTDDVAARKRAAASGTAPHDTGGKASAEVASRKAAQRRAAAAASTAKRAAGPVALVVGFRTGVEAAASTRSLGAARLAVRADEPLAALNARRVEVPRADRDRVVAALRADPAVAYVEVDGAVQAMDVVPDDPDYRYQTELGQITVPAAWSLGTGSAAVTVAVIDTGVTNIGDLTGALLPGWDFVNSDADPTDDEGHGSAVASLVAGRGNNGVGMAGVCWACRILPVKVLDSEGSGSYTAVAAGITFAADRGVKIINLSLGGYTSSTLLDQAVAYARGKGALVIAAAGNDAVSLKAYPASSPGVLAVGGTDTDSDWFVDFDPFIGFFGSNYGPDHVDVAAPWCTVALSLEGFENDTGGEDVDNDDYWDFCGTSASTPLVSGIAALTKSRFPGATAWSLEHSLTATAVPTTSTGFTRYGEVRAGRAVVTVDTTKPRITGATPAYATRFRGAVTLTATGVSDTGGAGVERVALYAGGAFVGQDTTAPYSVRYNSGTRNGTITFQWRVFDRAGNSAVLNRALIADNAKPRVAVTAGPGNNAKVKGTVTLKASASDPSGINRVELLINNKVVARDTTAAYSFKINVARSAKVMKVQVRAYDRVGNLTTSPARTWRR